MQHLQGPGVPGRDTGAANELPGKFERVDLVCPGHRAVLDVVHATVNRRHGPAPDGSGQSRRVEHRVAGADANVHLVIAAVTPLELERYPHAA